MIKKHAIIHCLKLTNYKSMSKRVCSLSYTTKGHTLIQVRLPQNIQGAVQNNMRSSPGVIWRTVYPKTNL